MENAVSLDSRMQEEIFIEHINSKCHLRTLWSTCRPLCKIGMHTTHNTIEPTHAKILTSDCTRTPSVII